MAKLTTATRNALPGKQFAGPGRSFPVNDAAHAKAAILDSGSAPPVDRAHIKAVAEAVLRRKG